MFFRTTSRDFADAYAAGRTNPEEVLEKTLDAIRESDKQSPPLGAFVRRTEALAKEAALASAKRWRRGKPLGPLDGVPVAIKDEFDLAEHPTGAGTTFRGSKNALVDAAVVARLRKKGAVIVGKTHMTEIGLGGTGLNAHFPTPRNPHDLQRLTGGSSSGSAAAVAAGICPLALGSDAGGSIRIPAAWCGIYGLKPTYGRVPSSGGALLSWSLDHLGPIGASVDDLAAFMDVASGKDAKDPSSLFGPHPRRLGRLKPGGLKGMKFGWCPEFADDADPDVRAAFHETLKRLSDQGAKVEKVKLHYAQWIHKVGYITFCAEAATSQHDWLNDFRQAYNLDTRLVLAIGENISAVEYLHAQRVRQLIRQEFDQVCGRFDAFLHPTTAGTAAHISDSSLGEAVVDTALNDRVSRYTFAGTLTGFPCVTIPCGVDSQLMPIGLELMSGPWSDGRLLQVAFVVDQVMEPMAAPKALWDAL